MDRKPVEMMRLPRQEQFFDREEVFGRDVTSVFPTQSKQEAAEAAKTVVAALGAKKFISETELEEIKKTRGGTVEDGTVAVDKSLAEQLAENKAKKDAEFQDMWRKMKEGTQRPLDTEEVEFLDTVLQQRSQRERDAAEEQRRELEAFREALKQRTVATASSRPAVGPLGKQDEDGDQITKPSRPSAPQPSKPVLKPIIKPIIKARPKGANQGGANSKPEAASAQAPSANNTDLGSGQQGALQDSQVGAKRRREEDDEDAGADSDGDGGRGLIGLLGGYSSDSDTG